MRHQLKILALIVFVSFCNAHMLFAADEETLAQQAEQSGKLRDAVTHYVSALQSVSEGSSKDQQLREKIISLVQKLTPPPAVPEEAIRYEGRAEAALKSAKTKDDLLDAAKEYNKALRIAPWLASYYFNLGIVLEKAENYSEAIRNFKLYLLAAPNAPDSVDVKKKIAGLEYTMEKTAKDQQAEEQQRLAKQREENEQKERQRRIAGRWDFKGQVWFRINVSGDNVEIIQVEECYMGDCNRKNFPNRKFFRGRLEDRRLVGYVHIYPTEFEQNGRKCSTSGGDMQTTADISADGREIKWGVIKEKVYGGCSSPEISFGTWVKE